MQLWLIPVLPLAGFLLNGIFGRRFSKTIVNTIAIGSVLLSFAWVLKTLAGLGDLSAAHTEQYFTWIQSGSLNVGFDFTVDRVTRRLRHVGWSRRSERRAHRTILHLDSERQSQRWIRFHSGSAHRHHAAGGDRCRLPDPYLLDRLHGARRGLLPFLRLHEPVHVLHAHAGAGGQLPGDVRGLGRRGLVQLFADRLLLR